MPYLSQIWLEPADSSWRSCHAFFSSGLSVSMRLCRKSLTLSGSWALLWLPAAKLLLKLGGSSTKNWCVVTGMIGGSSKWGHGGLSFWERARSHRTGSLSWTCSCWDVDISLEENGSSYDSTPFAKHIDCVSLFFLGLNLLFAVFTHCKFLACKFQWPHAGFVLLLAMPNLWFLYVFIFELIFRAEPSAMYLINASCLSISHLSRMMEQEQLSHSCALAGLDGEKACQNFSCSSRLKCWTFTCATSIAHFVLGLLDGKHFPNPSQAAWL